MKPIKKITLKDAKVLSDSELRNITGGYTAPSEKACPTTEEQCSGSCTTTIVYEGKSEIMTGTCKWATFGDRGMCGCVI